MKSKKKPVPEPRKIVTQKDIANDLGISLITVQRALNNSGYVSLEVRNRINEYVKKNDYHPHRAASSLARGSRELICLFSTEEPSSFWTEVKKGILTATGQIEYLGFQVEYYQIPYADIDYYIESVKSAIDRDASAIAVVNNHEYDMTRIFAMLDKSEIPYAAFNIDAPESRRMYYVGPEYAREGQLAGNFFDLCLPGGGTIIDLSWKAEVQGQLPGADINQERLNGLSAYCTSRQHLELRSIVLEKGRNTGKLFNDVKQKDIQLLRNAQGIYIPHFEQRHFEELFSLLQHRVPIVTSLYSDFTVDYLHHDKISAVVFQDPVMQGYLTVKTLEHFIEKNQKPQTDDYLIVPQLMLKENTGLSDNHFKLFTEET